MTTNKKSLKLVLSGSGTLYPLHVGALNCLIDHGYDITHVTGVSGGAIVASAFASGYKGKDLENLVLDTLPAPNNLVDITFCPLVRWGVIKGNKIEKEMRKHFKPSFAETEIPLKVFAVNIDFEGNYGDPLYTVFGTEETPDQDIAEAVRASIAIPYVFTPKVIKGHRYIDGGVASNFPLSIYGEGEGVLGFHVRGETSYAKPTNVASYAMTLVRIMMESINREHIESAQFARTVVLKSDAEGLNTRMTKEEAQALIEEGYNQTEKALAKYSES